MKQLDKEKQDCLAYEYYLMDVMQGRKMYINTSCNKLKDSLFNQLRCVQFVKCRSYVDNNPIGRDKRDYNCTQNNKFFDLKQSNKKKLNINQLQKI